MRQGNCKLRNHTLKHSADITNDSLPSKKPAVSGRSLQQNSAADVGQQEQGHDLDFGGQESGSIILLQPLTDNARNWVGPRLPEDAQYFGDSVVIERRYFADVLRGLTPGRCQGQCTRCIDDRAGGGARAQVKRSVPTTSARLRHEHEHYISNRAKAKTKP
jgi:hypothetical protein